MGSAGPAAGSIRKGRPSKANAGSTSSYLQPPSFWPELRRSISTGSSSVKITDVGSVAAIIAARAIAPTLSKERGLVVLIWRSSLLPTCCSSRDMRSLHSNRLGVFAVDQQSASEMLLNMTATTLIFYEAFRTKNRGNRYGAPGECGVSDIEPARCHPHRWMGKNSISACLGVEAAEIIDDALLTFRFAGEACIAAVQDQPMMSAPCIAFRDDRL